jgi:hypothetical protein
MQSYFQESIIAKGLVPAGVDPRHIEGYILLACFNLSNLTWPEIRREVKIALGCIQYVGKSEAEACAQSWGL